jgi:hypothetical protein
MTEQTRAIIDYAYDDNAKEMRDAVYAAIQDKVMAHLEVQKQRVAQNLIAPQTDDENFENTEEVESENA